MITCSVSAEFETSSTRATSGNGVRTSAAADIAVADAIANFEKNYSNSDGDGGGDGDGDGDRQKRGKGGQPWLFNFMVI